jgi:hypothetical protein
MPQSIPQRFSTKPKGLSSLLHILSSGCKCASLNHADEGRRRFILIETEDYFDKLTAERVRRVIKGVPNAKEEALKKGLGGSFTYCELGGSLDLDRFFDGKGAFIQRLASRHPMCHKLRAKTGL